MKPQKPDNSPDLFRSQLSQIIDMDHRLVRLADRNSLFFSFRLRSKLSESRNIILRPGRERPVSINEI